MRRAGPLVWIGFDGPEAPEDVLRRIRDGDVGGVTLFARNIRDAAQTRALVRSLHAARPIPICIDQEGGTVVRIGFGTVFPSAMAFGATRDASLVERAAAVVARELRALGIGVVLAPVCDVSAEPANPVIGVRSYSDDPRLAGELAAAFVRGAQGAGVAATAKHFPGHGGTAVDSHLALPEVRDSVEEIERRDLTPFRAAIAAGVAQVMTAHVRYPALDERPATYSSAILEGLLRRRLAFDGVVCSDALEMRGAQLDGAVPAAETIAAGSDIALLSQYPPDPDEPERSLDGIDRAVATGRIGQPRLADALRRARAFAARWTCAAVDDLPAPDLALAREVAARALTHVGPPLPSLADGTVTCVSFTPKHPALVEELRDPVGVLEREMRRRFGARLTFVRDPRDGAVPRATALIIATSSAFFDEEQRVLARRLASDRRAVIVATRSPQDASLFPELPALLTYGDVPASLEAACACLAGERAPGGTLPVRLAGSSARRP